MYTSLITHWHIYYEPLYYYNINLIQVLGFNVLYNSINVQWDLIIQQAVEQVDRSSRDLRCTKFLMIRQNSMAAIAGSPYSACKLHSAKLLISNSSFQESLTLNCILMITGSHD